ncbi:glutathione S-transferase [Pseudomonas matsuisoli]|uniref:glutathione transferase n=1 Tax=Pseudomonas matsuisoli TaxID=1515666 RepID=A0A917PX85_9PSED|nr:glutathione S-transferase [Pseudomonas matsuisoli]GGJ98077.1 glutathione S-transferase [Pseudomonas matsuisoli]
MITLHHLNNSRSQRVLWLLEELELDYEIVRYERDPQTLAAPASLRSVHPLGKSPVLVDDGLVLAESAVIVEYLAERYGPQLLPAMGTAERRTCSYWLHYAEGSLMPLLLMKLVFKKVEGGPMPFFVKPVAKGIAAKVNANFIDPRLRQHLDFVEAELADRDWLVGDALSVADIQMSFPLEAARARGGLGARPRLNDYIERIHTRPAYQRALVRGGEYAYA